MARTNISVDEKAFDEFSYQAERQGKTLFAFANETLSAVSKICSEGGNPTDLYRLWHSISILRQIDVITLPSDFIDELIAKLYASDKAGTLKMFQELGSSLVGLLKIIATEFDELAETAKDFILILPIKSLNVTRKDQDSVEISIVGAGRKIESTECAFEFVKSLLTAYGYEVAKQELGIGTIKLSASKRRVKL